MTNKTPQQKVSEIKIEGMHCANCALGIERHLKVSGFPEVNINFATASANLGNLSQEVIPQVVSEIKKLGYKINLTQPDTKIKDNHLPEIKLFICAALTVPLLLHMFLPFHLLHDQYFQLALSTPVYLIGLLTFGRSAWKSAKTMIPNMDVLIVLGSSAAFLYSITGTLQGLGEGFLFYETAASIVTFVMIGNYLEKRSVKKTSSAIEELSKIQPQKALRIDHENQIKEIDANDIRINDKLSLNTGGRIAADGVLLSDFAEIDESMITGESEPVRKKAGDKLTGGTILLSDNIVMLAERVGAETILSGIIRLVKNTQVNKPEIQKIGDKVSAYFVPAVVLISLITFTVCYSFANYGFQQSFLNAIAVLVISCPCAMGLATPTAVMVAIGAAAKKGILIKGGGTLENIAGLTSVVFDKTGTLTDGNFHVSRLRVFDFDEGSAKSIIKSIERYSSHPLAKSLVEQFISSADIDLKDISERKGLGIEASDLSGNRYKLGSFRFFEGIKEPDVHNLYLSKNNRLICAIDVDDLIKPEAQSTVEQLKSMSLMPVIISGDKKDRVEKVAGSLGIQNFHAETLPEQKLAIVSDIQKQGLTAFVGDGINDAPALVQADVGISLSNASQAAIESAQVIIVGRNLSSLIDAINLSRITLRVIKQNLFWAFFYNIVAIPFAAFGFLSPLVAALVMAFSDVIVIGNSLRIKSLYKKSQSSIQL